MNSTAPSLVPTDPSRLGDELYDLVAELYPICRSITGDGFRRSLQILGEHIPLTLHEVPTGTEVLDWSVPREWNIRDAYVKDAQGRRVIDFRAHNLHVVSYSAPVHRRMPLAELRPHLYTLPDQPDLIPYRTSYYKDHWGFCLSHNALAQLADGEYEVCIDASLAPGSLTYGECLIHGSGDGEVLISCHSCHPSLCNDNLSGMAVATYLACSLRGRPLRYSYRFLFIPGTIGAITWLARNEAELGRVRHGLVIACVGDGGHLRYKQSRRGDAEIDRAVRHVLGHSGAPFSIDEFSPYGYDERQYCSPGFNLPVGSLTRTPHGRFPEYHTSADNLDFVRPECLADSLAAYLAVAELLEQNLVYRNTSPRGEPQLGRRGLYSQIGGQTDTKRRELALLWVLSLSDGEHDLLAIADRAGLDFPTVAGAAAALEACGLLVPA